MATAPCAVRQPTAPRFSPVAALCLGLTACGGTGMTKNTTSVRDFRLVEVGKIHLQIAADGRSAVVQVQTNPPTVCAIAYGRTPALGSIADDPDMGGTAISHHTVVLGGLAPGTTYRFLLTATDAAGRVFQTPAQGTFTTRRETFQPGRDVAVGAKIVAVSSQWSSAFAAANAVDGNLSTAWASNGDGDRAFIDIDLGRQRKVTGISFVTREMSDGSAVTRTFAVVVDGRRRYGPFPAGSARPAHSAGVVHRPLPSFRGRQSTGGNTGAAEIEVFSPS